MELPTGYPHSEQAVRKYVQGLRSQRVCIVLTRMHAIAGIAQRRLYTETNVLIIGMPSVGKLALQNALQNIGIPAWVTRWAVFADATHGGVGFSGCLRSPG